MTSRESRASLEGTSDRSGPPVAVIGAGFAGLVAARQLRRSGVPVTVLEASPHIGGLARTFSDGDGFTFDFGAHFITNRLAAEIGVEDLCRDVRHYGEVVVVGGRRFSYPFGLLRSPRYAASALRSRLGGRSEVISAADVFTRHYGRALAHEVILPLLESWSGAPASELAPSVADKLPSLIGQTMWLKLASRLTRRAVAIGYCREMPQSARVWHVYPNDGLGLLTERLAESVSDAIRTNAPVQAVYVEEGRVVGLKVDGEDEEVAAVFSTAPVHVLPRLVVGTSALDHLAQFRYRPMTFVNVKLKGRGLLPDVVTWTPSSDLPFFRLTEAPMSMPWLTPEGKTIITADLGCEVGDETWTMDDDALTEWCREGLRRFVPDEGRRFMGSAVLRTPLAYPKFLQTYEDDRAAWERSAPVEGFYAVGRNGEFQHILMEDVYWRTVRKVDAFLAGRRPDPAARAGLSAA